MEFDEKELGTALPVFRYLEEISRIARPSGNHEAIVAYLLRFAEEHGIEAKRDAADNVLMKKPASAGYADAPTVILQGHTDMVAVKRPDLAKDMQTEGVDLWRDGDFLRAKGTSLGADDAVAVAYALAILADDTLPHPALEVLLTSDEEIGLLGAAGLDPADLSGRLLLNLDSDREGVFTVGCAGGVRCDFNLKLIPAHIKEGSCYRICLSGLTGGHSGTDIHPYGRANAIRLLYGLLHLCPDLRLCSLSGGTADNAIASSAEAVVVTDTLSPQLVESFLEEVRGGFADSDPNLTLDVEQIERPKEALSFEDTCRILQIFKRTTYGVLSFHYGLMMPSASQNLGTVSLEKGDFRLCVSVRADAAEKKEAAVADLRATAEAVQADFSTRGDYPAWEYKETSPLRDKIAEVYRRMYEKDAAFLTVHAGLECGVFAGKMPDVDCVSFGPDNFDLHSVDEHLSISSTVRVYEFLCELLASLKG